MATAKLVKVGDGDNFWAKKDNFVEENRSGTLGKKFRRGRWPNSMQEQRWVLN